jgi:hypothetical protein
MTAENNFNVKPLTSPHYVTPTNQSGEQAGRNSRRYKRKSAAQQPEELEETANDNGDDMTHVIDYCA